MSTISNRHSVVPFVSGKSVPFENQRLCKVTYKARKGTAQKFPNVCVSVPTLQGVELSDAQMDRLIPHLVSMMENAQDGIVRSLYESTDGSLTSVSDEEISVDQIISYLETEAAGGRLTKELIEQWFTSAAQTNCAELVATKLGTEVDNPKVAQHVNAYRAVFSSLAGGKTLLSTAQIRGCKIVLESLEELDDVGTKLMARLTSMETPKKIEELLEL